MLQFDLQTYYTWINTTIINSTHVQDGNEIVSMKHSPFARLGGVPRLPTVILYSMDAEKVHLGKRAYCSCVKRSLTPKGLIFLNLFLFMILCLLPLIVQKFGNFKALVKRSVERSRLSLKLFWIKILESNIILPCSLSDNHLSLSLSRSSWAFHEMFLSQNVP